MVAGRIVADGIVKNVDGVAIIFAVGHTGVVGDELLFGCVVSDNEDIVALRSGLGEVGIAHPLAVHGCDNQVAGLQLADDIWQRNMGFNVGRGEFVITFEDALDGINRRGVVVLAVVVGLIVGNG